MIIVDNGSADSTIELTSQFSEVTKTFVVPELKVGGVRNFGASNASCDILGFVDSDCTLGNMWRSKVITFFERSGGDAVGSKYELPDDPKWIERSWFSQSRKGRFPVKYINAGNFAISKKVFDIVGGFDGSLESGEDAELCSRLIQNDFVIINDSDVVAIHLGNPKTLKHFYRQQYWHSLGMLGTFRLDGFDKPLFATILFIILFVLSIILLVVGNYLLFFILNLFIPVLTVIYRVISARKFKYVFQLIILYYIYFLARSNGLVRILLRIS